MHKKRILLIGPMPPPSGGVSVHLSRLLRKSTHELFLKMAVFDLRKSRLFRSDGTIGNLIFAIYFFLRADVIHIHISDKRKVHLAYLCKFLGKKVMFTIHNPRDLEADATKRMIGISDRTIFVFGPEKLPENGIYIPAYIPADDERPLPSELENDLKNFSKLIISVSSYSGKEGHERDIYGFDLIFDAFEKIKLSGEYCLVLIDSTGKMAERYRNRVKDVELITGNKIFYISGDLNFPKLLKQSVLFIRATKSDGDSLSVREALNEGINVLASDCTLRPAGCNIFLSGDPIDLSIQMMKNLNVPLRTVTLNDDFAQKLFDVYHQI